MCTNLGPSQGFVQETGWRAGTVWCMLLQSWVDERLKRRHSGRGPMTEGQGTPAFEPEKEAMRQLRIPVTSP